MGVYEDIETMARKAREDSRLLASQGCDVKNAALLNIADLLQERESHIRSENEKDLEKGREAGLASAMLDRLELTPSRIEAMAEGLREVAALPDPVGEVTRMWRRPNGLLIGRMRIPLGVVGIIYESRPNVTVDAGGLCLKSGNGVILRGGSEAINSNRILGEIMKEGATKAGVPENAVQVVPVTDREAVDALLSQEEYIDLIIPRGGEQLIRTVAGKSRIPVLKHYKGVCHVYVDADANPKKARDIVMNAKTQRTGVCNAMETLLVHAGIAEDFLASVVPLLSRAGVEIRGCPATREYIPMAKPATEDDWSAEYLDLVLAVKIVDNVDSAIEHIRTYGSNHTESVVTENYTVAQRFLREVDSSSVMVNASTRFSDGFQYGLGAEIGISTSKVHAYGPMGLVELTTTKFIVYGDGQVRES
ncbi:MAG: glutamate-5-semialdehyde dehydrogenase [bacterium]